MSLKNKSIAGLFWAGVEKFGNRFLTLTIFFLLARLLKPGDFGVVAIVNSLMAFAQIFIEQGFTTALVQRKELKDKELDSAFWGTLGIGTLLFLIVFFAAPGIAAIYEEATLTPLVRVLSLSFIIGTLGGVQTALFQRDLNFKILATRQIVGTFVAGTVGVLMALNDYGVWSLVIYQLLNILVQTLIIFFTTKWKPSFRFSWQSYKELLSFGINIVGNRLLFFGNSHLVNLLIGWFLGTTALGYYSIGYKIFETFKDLIVNTFSSVLLPVFAKLQGDPKKLGESFHAVINRVSYIIFPACVLLSVFSGDILVLFFGPQWEPSTPIAEVLAIAVIFSALTSYCNDLMLGVGKAFMSFKLNLLHTGIYLTLFFLCVRLGLTAVALAYLLSMVVLGPIMIYSINRFAHFSLPGIAFSLIRSFLASALIYAAMYGIGMLWPDQKLEYLILKGVMFIPTYFLVLLLFSPDTLQELKFYLLKMLNKEPVPAE